MALLEIAEHISKMPVKPKRSVIFVWHTGEEAGLLGARFFTQNPTVPKDSIVAQINIDMIGRGRADDIPGGSDDFLGVVGSGFLSTELGEAVRSVNGKQTKPLALDYRFDGDVVGTLGPAYNNIYRRSDHFMYAQIGIPIAFFFTGLHADYHQVTDEPQYIDYKHYARITKYLNDLAIEIANKDKRLGIDKPTP
jgi:Zn-dependent M28 family amino/carboxypeptidase